MFEPWTFPNVSKHLMAKLHLMGCQPWRPYGGHWQCQTKQWNFQSTLLFAKQRTRSFWKKNQESPFCSLSLLSFFAAFPFAADLTKCVLRRHNLGIVDLNIACSGPCYGHVVWVDINGPGPWGSLAKTILQSYLVAIAWNMFCFKRPSQRGKIWCSLIPLS